MANTKISALTANTNPTGSEELVYAYNNANGKMTLDTMKTFAVSGKQDTLVSGTNIKTINNTSLLGSGNISISGGGESTFDAIVASDGSGDYTSVKAALSATKSRIFVKNGTYNHVDEHWAADSSSLGDVYIEGESKKGVIINFSSSSDSVSNRAFIHTNTASGSSGHSFYMKNMTINVAPAGGNAGDTGQRNALFKDTSSERGKNRLWRVENCEINFDTTNGGACLVSGFSIGTIKTSRLTTYPTFYSGFFGCGIYCSTGTYNLGLSTQPYSVDAKTMQFVDCLVDIDAAIVTGLQACVFYGSDVSTGDAGIQNIRLYYSGLSCDNIYSGFSADTIGGGTTTYLNISNVDSSKFNASTTVQPCDEIRLGEITDSSIFISSSSNNIKIINNGIWADSLVRADDTNSQIDISGYKVTGCELDTKSLNINSAELISGCSLGYSAQASSTVAKGYITGCILVGDFTVTGDSSNGAHIVGCRCKTSGQDITLNGPSCVYVGNTQYDVSLTLGSSATGCIVNGNIIKSFTTTSGSSNCVITGNVFTSSSHSSGTGHVYANNIN